MNRDRLLDAIAADDWTTLRELGWADVFRDLKEFFSPKHFSSADAMAVARVLGNHPPQVVHRAVQAIAESGEQWRPKPAALASEVMRLSGGTGDGTQRPVAGQQQEARRLDRAPQTVTLVRSLLTEGVYECACHWLASKSMHAGGVIRCAQCGGIDPGQVDDAKEAAA